MTKTKWKAIYAPWLAIHVFPSLSLFAVYFGTVSPVMSELNCGVSVGIIAT